MIARRFLKRQCNSLFEEGQSKATKVYPFLCPSKILSYTNLWSCVASKWKRSLRRKIVVVRESLSFMHPTVPHFSSRMPGTRPASPCTLSTRQCDLFPLGQRCLLSAVALALFCSVTPLGAQPEGKRFEAGVRIGAHVLHRRTETNVVRSDWALPRSGGTQAKSFPPVAVSHNRTPCHLFFPTRKEALEAQGRQTPSSQVIGGHGGGRPTHTSSITLCITSTSHYHDKRQPHRRKTQIP